MTTHIANDAVPFPPLKETPAQYRLVDVPTVMKQDPELWKRIDRTRQGLGRTVPLIADPETMYAWVVFHGNYPVGTLSATPYWSLGESFVEIGVRLRDPKPGVLNVGREWLAWLLGINHYIKARVFGSNKSVLRLLQHYGFRLVGWDYDLNGRLLEVYMLRRGELIMEKPRKQVKNG